MPRRIFVDTEWTAPMWLEQSALMWIGLADEAGRSWYAIASEADIDPATNDFIADTFPLIAPDDPRLTNAELATAIVDFCADVDEFWAWVPSPERFVQWSGLEEAAAREMYRKYWDWDLQLVRSLVQPWPDSWPDDLLDLNTAAVEAGVVVPPRAKNHMHPQVHVEWNRALFRLIQTAQTG